MSTSIDIAHSVTREENYPYLFSICTLVTRKQEYEEMLDSFIQKGFTTDQCEYMYIDNSEDCVFDGYTGLNKFLLEAKGKYVILCHQDIILHDSDINNLLNCIKELDKKDPNWAILGNAGGINLKWRALHLTEGATGIVRQEPDLPLQVKTVDENFIVVKKSANLTLSRDLSGFHLYAADLCLIADALGYTAYTIGFHLIHKSNGNIDQSFYDSKKKLIQKYKRAFRSRFISTTCTRFYLSGNIKYLINNTPPILFLVRQYYKVFTNRKNYKL